MLMIIRDELISGNSWNGSKVSDPDHEAVFDSLLPHILNTGNLIYSYCDSCEGTGGEWDIAGKWCRAGTEGCVPCGLTKGLEGPVQQGRQGSRQNKE
jgi:hypothetical protein